VSLEAEKRPPEIKYHPAKTTLKKVFTDKLMKSAAHPSCPLNSTPEQRFPRDHSTQFMVGGRVKRITESEKRAVLAIVAGWSKGDLPMRMVASWGSGLPMSLSMLLSEGSSRTRSASKGLLRLIHRFNSVPRLHRYRAADMISSHCDPCSSEASGAPPE
jgi:hypothetical protein